MTYSALQGGLKAPPTLWITFLCPLNCPLIFGGAINLKIFPCQSEHER